MCMCCVASSFCLSVCSTLWFERAPAHSRHIIFHLGLAVHLPPKRFISDSRHIHTHTNNHERAHICGVLYIHYPYSIRWLSFFLLYIMWNTSACVLLSCTFDCPTFTPIKYELRITELDLVVNHIFFRNASEKFSCYFRTDISPIESGINRNCKHILEIGVLLHVCVFVWSVNIEC